MKINSCYDENCDKENLSCLLDCNSMLTNILLLKDIHDKISKYDNLLDDEAYNYIHKLNTAFQKKFIGLCNDYIIGYDKIIDKYSP